MGDIFYLTNHVVWRDIDKFWGTTVPFRGPLGENQSISTSFVNAFSLILKKNALRWLCITVYIIYS